jgi:hypothetical protein
MLFTFYVLFFNHLKKDEESQIKKSVFLLTDCHPNAMKSLVIRSQISKSLFSHPFY